MRRVIKNLVKSNRLLFGLYSYYSRMQKRICSLVIPDEIYIRRQFKNKCGRDLNLENPIKFNDKIQWLKLNWHDPRAEICADKYLVREYVKERIGKKYLNQLYHVFESIDEINIDKLPNSFVLKGTHGSGYNIVCEDKSRLDKKTALVKLKRWHKENYYWYAREWVYKNIKPRVICERFLVDMEYEELPDYKIFCFNGEPRMIQVDLNRFSNHKRNLYDLDWNLLDVEMVYPKNKDTMIKRPEKLNEMLGLSKILSEGFPHVRVDFYIAENTIYFGELTFFSEAGYGKIIPEDFELIMGKWLKLPEKNLNTII